MSRAPPVAAPPPVGPAGTGPVGTSGRLAAWLEVAIAGGAAFAWDSDTVLFLDNEAGHHQPWATRRQGGSPHCIRETPERVGAIVPSPTRPEAILLGDRGGDEHWQLELLKFHDPGAPVQALTAEPRVVHGSAVWSSDGAQVYFTSNARDPRFFDVYAMDASGGARPHRILQEDSSLTVLDAREGRVLVARHRTNLDTDLLVGDGTTFTHLNPHTEEQTVLAAAIGAEDVYAAANPHRERTALVRMRPGRPGPEFLREYPGDVELLKAVPDGSGLVLAVNHDGISETHLFDPSTGEDRPLSSGPRGVIGSLSVSPDGSGLVYDVSTAEGEDIYFRSLETGKERRLTRPARPPPGRAVDPKPGSVRSSDGLTLPYFEYLPADRPPRGTVVQVHGGPEAQFRPAFSPVIQFLVGEGWRVVAPNVRGSTGYGRTFVHLDDGRRRMDSVRDLKEVVDALVRNGHAEPGRIAVAGGSYGGFMVLAGLTTYPDLFAAGIDIVGIANFLTFLENTGPWRRRLREAEYGSLEHDGEFLREISPLFHADRIRAPLLVVHGRNDPRVPFSEAEQIVQTLRANGRPVELLEYPDEGHGLHRREHMLETWTRASEFLAEHIPGRVR